MKAEFKCQHCGKLIEGWAEIDNFPVIFCMNKECKFFGVIIFWRALKGAW